MVKKNKVKKFEYIILILAVFLIVVLFLGFSFGNKINEGWEEIKKSPACVELDQNYFNRLNTDLVISRSAGCVRIMEDINFDHSIILRDGSQGFYLTCDNHTIIGSSEDVWKIAFELYDHTSVTNCNVRVARGGFLLYNSSKVLNSEADLIKDGFQIHDNALVSSSLSKNCRGIGLELFGGNPSVYNSISSNCTVGVLLADYSSGYNIRTYNNTNIGFNLRGHGSCENCYSDGNRNSGYHLTENSKISNSQALNNGAYGILLDNNASAENILSDNNINGVFVSSGARLLTGYRVCYNERSNIYSDGGYIEGVYRSTNIEGNGNFQNATILPCATGVGSPIFLKARSREIGDQ